MKKIILISMIASGLLLAGTVTDLTTDIGNDITNPLASTINNSNVSQGHTIVSGTSNINKLNIIQRDLNNNAGNIINTVNIDSSTVNQGLTHINDGKVSDSTLNSNSSISNGSIANSTVNQASTIVNNDAELDDSTVISRNSITGVINDSNVSQATLELNNNGTELEHANLTSTNTIALQTVIDDSEVHQARVRIGGGYDVSHLTMTETNTLVANINQGSNVVQGGIDVCSNGASASTWCHP